MKHSNAFDLLIELSTHQTNEVAQKLGKLVTEREQAGLQLEALNQYRLDYAQRLLEAGQSGVTMSNYMNFRRFIGTLDEAIQQQNKLVDILNQKIVQQQAIWIEEKQRLNAYETLQERRRAELSLANSRREQRLNDEMSASLFQRAQHSY